MPSTLPLSPPQPLPHVVGVKPSPSLPFAGVVGHGAIRTVAVVELMCSAAVAFLAVCGADDLGDSDRLFQADVGAGHDEIPRLPWTEGCTGI